MDLNGESCQFPVVSHHVKYFPVNGDGAVPFFFFFYDFHFIAEIG